MKTSLDTLILQELKHINLNLMTLINYISNQTTTKSLKETGSSENLIRLTEWNKYHSYPKIGGMRNIIYHADFNGVGICIKKVGRNIWIDEKKFFDWLKTNPKIQPKIKRKIK